MSALASAGRRVAWRADSTLAGFGLGAALVVASAATVDKYLGLPAVLAYAVVLLAAMPQALAPLSRACAGLGKRRALWLALATLVVLVLLFAVVYPHANTHSAAAGSDRDDASDLGARALLHGRYPYEARTYLGNPISQFPGGLVLAAPFVALGHSAYAAFFWLPLLFVLLVSLAGDARLPLVLLWLGLAVSPAFVREIVTGGDLIANSVAVMAGAWLVLLALERRSLAGAAAASVLLGVALSWRLNFLFVLPPLVVAVLRRHGRLPAVAVSTVTAGAFALVTLPFYLPHRADFPPIAASDKLVGFDGAIPGGARAVVAVGLGLSVVLALLFRSSARSVFGQTAAVQAFFVLAIVALASGQAGGVDLGPLVPGYGLPVLLFALPAVARRVVPARGEAT